MYKPNLVGSAASQYTVHRTFHPLLPPKIGIFKSPIGTRRLILHPSSLDRAFILHSLMLLMLLSDIYLLASLARSLYFLQLVAVLTSASLMHNEYGFVCPQLFHFVLHLCNALFVCSLLTLCCVRAMLCLSAAFPLSAAVVQCFVCPQPSHFVLRSCNALFVRSLLTLCCGRVLQVEGLGHLRLASHVP